MKCIMFTGVCGVGKTTLTRKTARAFKLTKSDYADYMLEVMKQQCKDTIQKLDWSAKRKIYDYAAETIREKFRPGGQDSQYHILENHLTIIQNDRVVTFPTAGYQDYNLAALIVVEASPAEILQRRQRDPERQRRSENLEMIEQQQQQNRKEAQKIHQQFNAPCLYLNNSEGALPDEALCLWLSKIIISEIQENM